MSETTPEKPAEATQETPTAADAKPETDWKAEARKWEQRAKENSKAADQLAALEEANKTELQKTQERAQKAEERAAQAELTALKVRVAAEMNVPVEVLHGNDEDTVRAAAQKVIEWRDAGKKPAPKPSALKSGASSADEASGKERAAHALRQLRGSA